MIIAIAACAPSMDPGMLSVNWPMLPDGWAWPARGPSARKEKDTPMAALTPTMQGKICLVTGATSGIGLVTARALAQQGATVVLVGRNPERTTATVSRLQQETGNAHVECLMADLSVQAQVRQLVGEFQRRFARLDVLL